MKKTRIIIIVLIIIIIGLVSFTAYNNYANQQDNLKFNQTMKTASDLENVTDDNYAKLYEKETINVDDVITHMQSRSDNMTQEIDILTQYKNNTRNETYKAYLDIEVNRIKQERIHTENEQQYAQYYKDYKEGKISLSKLLNHKKDIENYSEEASTQTSVYKGEVVDYLKEHPDLNKTLVELKIDEDFSTQEYGGTGNSSGRLTYI